MGKLKIIVLSLFCIFVLSSLSSGVISQDTINFDKNQLNSPSNDDFYFVHLTDTHVMHKLFDRKLFTQERFSTVLEKVTSFETKPAFIVVTGDLCEWGGGGITGALNCKAFVNCLYENDNQLYADAEFTIPVYTTPGNHDYNFNRNLNNYHKYINKNHIDEEDRYIVTYGNVSLFFMDSGPNYYLNPLSWFDVCGAGLYDDDIEWLDDALNNCQNKKIVLMHHPTVNKRKNWNFMGGVIARNRENFINLCEENDVELVLAGHTHNARVFDSNEDMYEDLPLNSSLYSTLYVQSDDCKQGVHYRNISIVGNDIWIESNQEIEFTVNQQDINSNILLSWFFERLKEI